MNLARRITNYMKLNKTNIIIFIIFILYSFPNFLFSLNSKDQFFSYGDSVTPFKFKDIYQTKVEVPSAIEENIICFIFKHNKKNIALVRKLVSLIVSETNLNVKIVLFIYNKDNILSSIKKDYLFEYAAKIVLIEKTGNILRNNLLDRICSDCFTFIHFKKTKINFAFQGIDVSLFEQYILDNLKI